MMRRMRSDPLLLILAVRPEGSSRLPAALAGQVGEWVTLQGLSGHAVRDLSAELGQPRLSWQAATRVQVHTVGGSSDGGANDARPQGCCTRPGLVRRTSGRRPC